MTEEGHVQEAVDEQTGGGGNGGNGNNTNESSGNNRLYKKIYVPYVINRRPCHRHRGHGVRRRGPPTRRDRAHRLLLVVIVLTVSYSSRRQRVNRKLSGSRDISVPPPAPRPSAATAGGERPSMAVADMDVYAPESRRGSAVPRGEHECTYRDRHCINGLGFPRSVRLRSHCAELLHGSQRLSAATRSS